MRRFERLERPAGEPDDLTKIKGIGVQLAAALNKAGIFHFWQVAALSADDLPAIGPLIDFKGRLDWDAWIKQAQKLAPQDSLQRPSTGGGEAGATEGKKAEAGVLSVKTKRGVARRRRANREFGPEPVSIPLAELSAAARAAIENDPALVVERK